MAAWIAGFTSRFEAVRKIAVFGSRKWAHLQDVALKISALYEQHGQFILVSGGADGPSKMAEVTALEFGMPVISFRPVKLPPVGFDDSYGVDEWRLYRGGGKIIHHHAPDWANYDSALGYRSLLLAERAEEGIAYWDGHSRGTNFEIGLFTDLKKPLEVIR